MTSNPEQSASPNSAASAPGYDSVEWISLPDAAAELGVSSGRLHRLIEDHFLLAVKHDGRMAMPAAFVQHGEPLAGLRGTLTLLEDYGIVGREAMDFLLAEDDFLEGTPIAALQAGHKSTVRKAVQLFAV